MGDFEIELRVGQCTLLQAFTKIGRTFCLYVMQDRLRDEPTAIAFCRYAIKHPHCSVGEDDIEAFVMQNIVHTHSV